MAMSIALVMVLCLLLVALYGTTTSLRPRHHMRAIKTCDPTCLRVVILYGTRPEAIKLAPVIHQFANVSWACPLVVSTGQHREMLRTLEPYLGIAPDVDMGIMKRRQRPEDVLTATMRQLDGVFGTFRPHLVIVQGDTTSAMAAAIAAFHAGVHVAHVEAGLRTGDMGAPFPEEFNRRVISMVASLNFAPTALAETVLRGEGVPVDRVFVTGNTVVDALHSALASPPKRVLADGGVRLVRLDVGGLNLSASGPDDQSIVLTDSTASLQRDGRHVVLVTAHRRENAQSGAMVGLAQAVARVARSQPGTLFVVPLHLSPAVRDRVVPPLIGMTNVWLVAPPEYPIFVQLLTRVTLILTDSGGLQEEALALGLPVLIARRSTERMEGVQAGGALLVGDDAGAVEAALTRMLTSADDYERLTQAANPYGDGRAAERIARIVRANVGRLKAKPLPSGLCYRIEGWEIGQERGGTVK